MKSDHFFHHWKYLGLEQKQHYQKNQFYSMLIVTGLVVLALALSVVWPERVVPVPLTPGGDGTGRTEVARCGGISKALRPTTTNDNAVMSVASVLLPDNVSRRGYITKLVVVRDKSGAGAPTRSVSPEPGHELFALTDPSLAGTEQEPFPDLALSFADYDMEDYDDLLPPDEPYLPEIGPPGWGPPDGRMKHKGTIALAPLIWPRYIDTVVSGTVTLLVTIPQSKLKPKTYEVLHDDAGFRYAVMDMLDRSRIRPPVFDGERKTVTVEWTFLVCWRCECMFASSEGLFEEVH